MHHWADSTIYKREELPDTLERLSASTDQRSRASAIWRVMEDRFIEKWTGMTRAPAIIGVIPATTETAKTFVERLVVDSNWPSNITVASIRRIEYVHEVRMVGKGVTIDHDESGIRARVSMDVEGTFE